MKTVKYSKLVLILTYALSLTALLRAQSTSAEVQLNLMPVPASVQIQTGRLPIAGSFNVLVKNYADDRLRHSSSLSLKNIVALQNIQSQKCDTNHFFYLNSHRCPLLNVSTTNFPGRLRMVTAPCGQVPRKRAPCAV